MQLVPLRKLENIFSVFALRMPPKAANDEDGAPAQAKKSKKAAYCFTVFLQRRVEGEIVDIYPLGQVWNEHSCEDIVRSRVDFTHVKFLAAQLERTEVVNGQGGLVHIQGYVELKSWMRYPKQIKERVFPGSNNAHVEPRAGDQSEAVEYCEKSDTRIEGTIPFRYGVPSVSHQGQRSDITDLVERVYDDMREGNADIERNLFLGQHAGFVSRSMTYAAKIVTMAAKEVHGGTKTRYPVDIVCLWGYTGTGKSRRVNQLLSESPFGAYKLCGSLIKEGSVSWQNYLYERILWIEECGPMIGIHDLQMILDPVGYSCMLNVKYGSSYAAWKIVLLTSNQHPRYWLPANTDSMLRESFLRRFKQISYVATEEDCLNWVPLLSPPNRHMLPCLQSLIDHTDNFEVTETAGESLEIDLSFAFEVPI
jgi:hypothetical protein